MPSVALLLLDKITGQVRIKYNTLSPCLCPNRWYQSTVIEKWLEKTVSDSSQANYMYVVWPSVSLTR